MSAILPALVSADELHAVIDQPDVLVLDATTFLSITAEGVPYTSRPGREEYLAEHIPGAVLADIQGDLSDPESRYAFTLPSPQRFAAGAGRLGIGDRTHVVAYDNVGNAWATRIWWLLRVFGHEAVSILDGGLRSWKSAGYPVESGEVTPTPANFTPAFRSELVADKAEVERLSKGADTNVVVVNALDEATFRGEQEISPYTRRGRIPKSRNLPATTLLDPATGRLLDTDQLAEKLQSAGILGADRAVTYCGGGIAATLPAFAAYLVSGVEIAVYDGSLSEWTADESLPVEGGSPP